MKQGRPPKTLEDLPEDWEEKCLEMAKKGATDVMLRTRACGGISYRIWARLLEQNEHFRNTVYKCRELADAYLDELGYSNLKDRDFSYQGYKMLRQNRSGDWREASRVTISGDKDNPLKIDTAITLSVADKADIAKLVNDLDDEV